MAGTQLGFVAMLQWQTDARKCFGAPKRRSSCTIGPVLINVNPLEPCVSSLPVAAVLPDLLHALQRAPQVLLTAPTGAGKSTWLPLQLLQQGGIDGRILLLEPRRLAARNVAQRLAECLMSSPATPSATG
jgi:ATP-dependent helicase HrpB